MLAKILRKLPLLLTVSLLSAFGFVTLATVSAGAQSTSSIAQGFTTSNDKGDIVAGAIVSTKPGGQTVELATTSSANQIVGVADQSPLVLISNDSKQAQIVLSGTTRVLVSDINGDIKTGDRITASPIAGVGMLASSSSRIVGVAQADFSSDQTQEVTDIHNQQHKVHIGYVPLQVGVANYQAPGSNFLPPFVQNFANDVAGKQVSIIRILFCSILLIISFVTLAIFISSSARSAMVSIGRNPLASADIRKSLYQVAAITIAAWGGSLLACYLILTL